MAKIKVAHLITLLELGGAQGNTLFTVEHLNRKDFEVLLICGKGGISDEKARKIPDLKTVFVKNLIRSVHPVKDLLCLLDLIRILKNERPDIVHTHSSKAGILGRIAAFCAGVPVIIHSIHGFGFNPYQKFFVRRLFVLLEKWTAKISRSLIAVSEKNILTGLELGIAHPDQYSLIRSGVDIQEIKKKTESSNPSGLKEELSIPENVQIVLTVGPFKIQKDPLAFVSCASKITSQLPEVKFLAVGDGELREPVEEEIRKLRLEKTVHLLGWRNDVAGILACSDVFVLTSLWEGLPRSAVEALIAGKPVVAYDVDGVSEVVKNGENGFLIPPGSRELFSEKLLQILKDKKLRQTLSSNAKTTIDRSFDIHEMVHQQEMLYRRLVQPERTPHPL